MELIVYNQGYIEGLTRKRSGETRMGEKVRTLEYKKNSQLKAALSASPCRYVLLGIPEDIGVRANFGRSGAYSAWQPSLVTLLNVQSNSLLTGEEILVLGHFDFTDLMREMKDFDFSDIQNLKYARDKVSEIDKVVYPVISAIAESGKEAIIIGGGHNNAYPNIRGAAEGLKASGKISNAKINSINCDAHSDLRPLEGRHSGNGFSYAFNEGWLDKYAMIGLHEIFNTHNALGWIKKEVRMHASFFEEIFIYESLNFKQAIQQAIDFTNDNYCGLELDTDTIQNIPASAKTSSGISSTQARQFVYQVASQSRLAYFHIAEAAPVLSHIKTDLKTGKLISYLITDYIKARNYWYKEKHETAH